MTQKYVAIVTRTTQYRVVIDPDSTKPLAQQVLANMEAAGEDIEQYRVKGLGYDPDQPYGTVTEVVPPEFTVTVPHNAWAIALPTDSTEAADIVANIAI